MAEGGGLMDEVRGKMEEGRGMLQLVGD